MEELATLHAAYRGRDLPWLRTPSGMRSKPDDPETAARRAQFIVSALDQFAADMPPVFRRLGELYGARSLDIIALFNEGDRTLLHGDTHSGNLFVDAGQTGFYDWAVAGRGPGVRDVAYFLCNSLPVETRRAEEKSLLAQYRSGLARHGVMLDEHTTHEQYRLFSVYSWIDAVGLLEERLAPF
jgi:Ser/Thr protein kinase RdoA (MazF antagonist)